MRALPFTALLIAGAAAVDRFAGEVARINHEREEEHRNNDNMAKAMLTKGVALANEMNARGERRRDFAEGLLHSLGAYSC